MSEESKGIFSCKGTSWIAAALLAFAAFLILRARYEVGFVIALVIALVLAVLVAWVLRRLFCAEVAETEGGFAARSAARAEERRQYEADRAEARAAGAAPADTGGAETAGAAGAAGSAGGGEKPQMLSAARAEGADDLKLIKGVGPKLEKLLNSLGVYHFDQIAAWSAEEVAWVDDNLEGFKGRVSRDGWVEQARILAEGGTTEFASKVRKGEVYD